MRLAALFVEKSTTLNQCQFHYVLIYQWRYVVSAMIGACHYIFHETSRTVFSMKNCVVCIDKCVHTSTYVQICIIIYKSQPFTWHHLHSGKVYICVWHQGIKTLFMFAELCKVFNTQLMLKSVPHIFMHVLVQVVLMQLRIKTHQYIIETNTAVGAYNMYLCKKKNMLDIYKMSHHSQR